MNGGYVMIDMKGINLNSLPTDPVDGIYEKFDSAFRSGKPIVVYGVNSGGADSSPAPVIVLKLDNAFIATVEGIGIRVNNDDTITEND